MVRPVSLFLCLKVIGLGVLGLGTGSRDGWRWSGC